MFDNRRRLDMDAVAVEQHRHVAPAGKRQEFGRPVHSLLEAHIAERERRARQAQHERNFVGRERVRAAI